MRPFVTVYAEVSADGKTSHRLGASSIPMMAFEDDEIRRYRHELRASSGAIMVGNQTVKLDDPRLTVRYAPGPNPLRVVASSMADIPITSHIVTDGRPTLVAASKKAPAHNVSTLNSLGVDVLMLGKQRVDIEALLVHLGAIGITSLMVEGGATLLSSFFRGDLVDRLIVQHLPIVIGGFDTPAMVGGAALASIDDVALFNLVELKTIGSHAVIIYDRR